jgi:cytosine/adenosine deaminase-related metal-dependent hydrolase
MSKLVPVVFFFTIGVMPLSVSAQSIHDIQYTVDLQGASPYVGQVVTVNGLVTSTDEDGYVIAEAPGPWHAVYVYSRRDGPRLGDEVEITGLVSEYYGMTEVKDITSYQVLSTGNPITPTVVDAAAAAREMYESVLVRLNDLTVTDLLAYGEWVVSDASGTIACDDMNDYVYFPQIGDELLSVTGVVFYTFGAFKVEPRFTLDIEGDVIPHFALGGDVVTMNTALDVIADAYVEVLGDRIIGIHAGPPAGVPVVETGGLIFPGLIDSHNHGSYNVLDHIPFGQTFQDRSEWQAAPLYADFNAQLDAMELYAGASAHSRNVSRLFETRALCAGTTTIQGGANSACVHQGIIVNNAERFPSRTYKSVFPLSQSQTSWIQRQGEYYDRFVVHLAEGINAGSLQEFATWQSWGMLDWRTTLIHGVPLGPPELQAMAAAEASLVWSPTSNMVLYGATADIPGALAAGVNVALAPDWTPSGGRHLLDELKFADEVDQDQWGNVIAPVQLALFVTRNAAHAMGAPERIGQVGAGFQADLMVIPGDPADPYPHLVAAEPRDVLLTVVSGRPMYGDRPLLDQFGFLDLIEDIEVCGAPKALATRITSHSITDSDKPMSDVIAELEAAYAQATPVVCDFLGPYNCTGLLGDATGDGAVDVADLLAVLAAWGQGGVPADVNGDGIVDVLDLLLVLAEWTTG